VLNELFWAAATIFNQIWGSYELGSPIARPNRIQIKYDEWHASTTSTQNVVVSFYFVSHIVLMIMIIKLVFTQIQSSKINNLILEVYNFKHIKFTSQVVKFSKP
jgi:hypothetical protein